MIKFKKFLAATMTSVMMFGVVASAAPVLSVFAADTASVTSSAGVDYANFQIEVSSSDKVVFMEVLKTNDADSKVSATYSFPCSSKVMIDLSFLKAAKEQYIRFYGANGVRGDIITVAAQPAKFSVKFALKSTVEESFTGKGFDSANLENYEYRNLYASTWKDVKPQSGTALDITALQNFSVTGATLVMRVKADTTATKAEDKHPASAEVKVKIPAAAKAPKVSFDYAKGIISTGKGAEYTTEPSDPTKWQDVKDTKLSVADFRKGSGATTTDGTAALTVYVRTKATEKKAASNMVLVTIPKDAAFASGAKFTEDNTSKALSGSIAMDGDESSKKVSASTVVDKKDDTKVSAVFKAEGSSFDFSTDDGKTWKTVKAGKTFVVDQTSSSKVKIRRSGDKVAELLPSKEIEITIPAYVKSTTTK